MAKAVDIVQIAKDKYAACKEGWQEVYQEAREDMHFLSGEENAQWDKRLLKSRRNRPVYTVDQLGQFIHQVENDERMNTPTINISPADGESDVKTAEIFKGIIKGIEYKSNADAAYDNAGSNAIRSSFGFIKIVNDYCEEDGFLQELYIKRVVNPLSCYIDPASVEPDGSDAMFGFELEEMTVEEFKGQFPNKNPISFEGDTVTPVVKEEGKVTIANYYVIEEMPQKVGLKVDGTIEAYQEGIEYKSTRSVNKRKVMHYKLSGEEELAKTKFAGKYIPLIPVYGEEAWIEGKRCLQSLIRKSKASQMMYNLTKSIEIEMLMKQPQAPFIAPAGAVTGFEEEYSDPSRVNVVTYNPTGVNGTPLSAPQRVAPPQFPVAFSNVAREAIDDIKATMGMYNASLGQRSNEQSGIAIAQRKQEGDVATFHFADNLVRSITQVGRVLVFAIPEIYDTERVVRMVTDEDEHKTIGINGKRVEGQEEDYDLTKGKFDVRVTTGASFTTQRQEAAAMYNQLIQAMPDLMPVIGDLVFKYQDSAGSQAIASRLKKLVDPKLLDEDEREEDVVDPEKEQMAAALQEMQLAMQQLQAELANKQADTQLKAGELEIKNKEVEIKAFEAQQKAVESNKQLPVVDNSADIAVKVRELELKEYEAQKRAEAEAGKFMLEAEKLKLETYKTMKEAQPKPEMGEMQGEDHSAHMELLGGIMQSVENLTNAIQNPPPATIVRDEAGNITGVV